MTELKEGEIKCLECKGTGNNPKAEENSSIDFICFRCRGTGKLDWIELAMGPRKIDPYDPITIPLIRHKYPQLIAKYIVEVPPMSRPDVVKGYKKNE